MQLLINGVHIHQSYGYKLIHESINTAIVKMKENEPLL